MGVKRTVKCLAACLSLSAAPLFADTPMGYTEHGKALFRIDVPDFWNVRIGGPRTLTPPGEDASREVARVIGLSPEGSEGIWMGFVVPIGISTIDQGVDYMREFGPHLVHDPEVSEQRTRTIGGRQAVTFTGKGRRNGKQVQFTAVLIGLPHNRVAFSVTVLENGFDAAVLEDVNDVYESFRAIGQGG